jgi:hypothetical protein
LEVDSGGIICCCSADTNCDHWISNQITKIFQSFKPLFKPYLMPNIHLQKPLSINSEGDGLIKRLPHQKRLPQQSAVDTTLAFRLTAAPSPPGASTTSKCSFDEALLHIFNSPTTPKTFVRIKPEDKAMLGTVKAMTASFCGLLFS